MSISFSNFFIENYQETYQNDKNIRFVGFLLRFFNAKFYLPGALSSPIRVDVYPVVVEEKLNRKFEISVTRFDFEGILSENGIKFQNTKLHAINEILNFGSEIKIRFWSLKSKF